MRGAKCAKAVENLDRQGRVHEIQGHDERIAAIAKEYAKSPENTLVISPDNRSRMEINERVHAELQRSGLVSSEEHRIRTLVPRQDLTGADRTWAERYEVGDVLRYSRASKETGIGKGEYAQVKSIDAPRNRLTVERRMARSALTIRAGSRVFPSSARRCGVFQWATAFSSPRRPTN